MGSLYSPPASMRSTRRQPLPVVGLWDCLTSPTFRSWNLPKFFAEQSERLGPAYRFRLAGKDLVILAGAEMNQWVGRKGRLHLRASGNRKSARRCRVR